MFCFSFWISSSASPGPLQADRAADRQGVPFKLQICLSSSDGGGGGGGSGGGPLFLVRGREVCLTSGESFALLSSFHPRIKPDVGRCPTGHVCALCSRGRSLQTVSCGNWRHRRGFFQTRIRRISLFDFFGLGSGPRLTLQWLIVVCWARARPYAVSLVPKAGEKCFAPQ